MLETRSEIDLESVQTFAPYAHKLFEKVLQIWPEHKRFIGQRLKLITSDNVGFIEKVSEIIFKIKHDALDELIRGYQWMCAAVLEEELYFRRNHQYRLTSFEEAVSNIYSNSAVMKKYMDGLLLSQVLWSNHTSVLQFFSEQFLAKIPQEFQLVEIGPGHGIFLYFAMEIKNCVRATGWDISESSLNFTKNTLSCLNGTSKLSLKIQDIFKINSDEKFDVIVLSEILEHLDNPAQALSSVKSRLTQKGQIFINVPCNSPAPDHIYLFRHPQEVFDLVSSCGYNIIHSEIFPATGVSLQRALDKALTTSVVVIATA